MKVSLIAALLVFSLGTTNIFAAGNGTPAITPGQTTPMQRWHHHGLNNGATPATTPGGWHHHHHHRHHHHCHKHLGK